MKTEIAKITPELAQELIDANLKRNRPHNKRRSKMYAEAMKRGEWVENGDTIRISENGALLDGQHRLWAIIYSGLSQTYIVVSGLKDEVFDTIDRGAGRTIGDVLSIRGEKNCNALAACARMLVVYDKSGNPFHGNPEFNPTAREVEQFIDENPSVRDAVSRCVKSAWIKRHLTGSLAAACRFIFWQVDLEMAEKFFGQLESGVFDKPDSPVLLLRDRLMEDKASKEKMTKKYMAAITFKAFRLFSAGESRRFLRVREAGPGKETDLFSMDKLKSSVKESS